VTSRPCVVVAWGLVALAATGCGAKGPPLPPLRPEPVAPASVTASRVGGRVTLRVTVPDANADPSTALSIAGVEIYARTLPMGSEVPTAAQLLRKEYLAGTIAVRPPAPVDETGAVTPPAAAGPPDARPGPGETAVWSEAIPATVPRPLDLNRAQKARVDARRTAWMAIRPTGLFVPWFRVPLPTRYYVAVGVSERRRPGAPSAIVAVPFGPSPEAPASPKLTYTESELMLTWTTTLPGAPVTVVESTRAGVERVAPVQELPITTGAWSTPVVFGVERCFVVRGVVRQGLVSTESATVGPVCETPVDRFGPPAPGGLVSVSGPDGVTLVWDAVTAVDLAGYLVLRGEGAGETLQALTPKPITSLQYADTTLRAGQRYVFAIVAVDTAGNRGPESNRVTIDRLTPTGR